MDKKESVTNILCTRNNHAVLQPTTKQQLGESLRGERETSATEG